MWTDEQKSAIADRGGNLLVSAAAGSGKTAVLVERIIRMVIDEKIDINKFLVVTFTSKAADEMKEKIVKAVSKEVLKDKENQFLRNQLSLVHKAQITTINSFCFNLIRDNFTHLNISPDFRIIDEYESVEIRNLAIKKVISKYFKELDKDFVYLVDILGYKNIEENVIKLYEFLQNLADPNDFLEKNLMNYENSYKNGFKTTVWYNEMYMEVMPLIKKCVELSEKTVELLDICEVLREKNETKFIKENEEINELNQAMIDSNWDKAYEIVQKMEFSRFGSCTKSEHQDVIELSKKYVDEYKELIGKIKKIIYLPCSQIDDDNKKLYNAILVLTNIVKDFEKEYSSAKKNKNVLDFSDAERKTIELLTENGEKSSICEEISKRFEQIMVDEYQDCNETQDEIFKLLSRNNTFMVGDVKQSIYKFRHADPSIFLEKYKNFENASVAKNGIDRKITLSKNFRSRDNVLDATNFIFENIMSKELGGVDYDEKQKLYLGAKYEENKLCDAEFCLVDCKHIKGQKTFEVEAKIIAKKINDLVKSGFLVKDDNIYRPIKYSDIAILLRSAGQKSYAFKKEIEKYMVDVDLPDDSRELFATPEILDILSFLKVIDNYLNQIDIVALMRSPIFSFSNDEIMSIKGDDIYYNLQNSKNEKVVKFFQDINYIKDFSEHNTVYKTIWEMINKFNILAKYALMDLGDIRYKNITAFIDFVSTSDENMTLYEFIQFIDSVSLKKVKLSQTQNGENSVKIVTMHSSKGLEYPVVFMCDLSKKHNEMDITQKMVLSKTQGIALEFLQDDKIGRYNSVAHKSTSFGMKKELIEEEMRVLYVAMTRAKEKLIMISSHSDASTSVYKWNNEIDAKNAKSYADFLMPYILKQECASVISHGIIKNIEEKTEEYGKKFEKDSVRQEFIQNILTVPTSQQNVILCEYISKMEDFEFEKQEKNIIEHSYKPLEYSFLDCTNIPSKVTATSVKDFSKDTGKNIEKQNIKLYYKKPKFIRDIKLSPAEIGIAHHFVMQFIDFKKCKDIEQIKNQIKKLLDEQFITKTQFECIKPEKISSFINSSLGERILKSENVIREFKFSMLVKASEFFDVSSDDKVLLQGVIDCMFEENGKMIIIDYKTDNVHDGNIDFVSSEHEKQLDIYAKAIERLYKKEVFEKNLYYFTNETIITF